ncbi:MAG TPA: alpha/beta hydrolase [Candidatus Nocardiopsis merdipullorum]|nr:alpha/beta hydrolase [Candidatus Nocardiopsis merdipullorum]
MTERSTLSGPIRGTAAGVPYLALPPASGICPAPLVLGMHAFEPPRSEAALAGAIPMASLPAWRVHLGLPLFGARLPEGGVPEINRRGERDYLVELFGPVVEEAAAELRRVTKELRDTLPVTEATALVGVGAGAAAGLLALAENRIEVDAAAVINPVVDPALVINAREKRTKTDYTWTSQAEDTRGWLNFLSRADELAHTSTPLLIVNGRRDEVVPPAQGHELYSVLARRMPEHALRHIVVPDLAHVIGPEPGLEPGPPTPAGVLTDRALTEWFHRQLTPSAQFPASEHG